MLADKNNINDSGDSQTESAPHQHELNISNAKRKSKQKESKKPQKRNKNQRFSTGLRKKYKADVCPTTSNNEERDDEIPAPFREDSGIDSNIEKSKRPVVDVPEGVDELNVRMKC